MSDTIGPDGLTDEERAWRSDSDLRGFVGIVGMFDALAAERLAHAAEKAAHAETRAERDRLAARAILDLPGMVPGYGYERSDIVKKERAKHAETEQAMHDALVALKAERDRLRAALEEMTCATEDSDAPAAHRALVAARALLGEVKP